MFSSRFHLGCLLIGGLLQFGSGSPAQSADYIQENGPIQTVKAMREVVADGHDLDLLALRSMAGSLIEGEIVAVSQPADPSTIDGNGGVKDKKSIAMLPLRLVLSQFAVQTSAKHHAELLTIAGENTRALTLQTGRFSLADLQQLATHQGLLRSIQKRENDYLAQLPIFIMANAQLDIKAGEKLTLSKKGTSFIANMGVLTVLNGAIVGSDEKAPNTDFRPFILSALGATMLARDSHFESLGFAKKDRFSGIELVSNALFPKQTTARLTGNRFVDISGLELTGLNDFDILNNVFVGLGQAGISILETRRGKFVSNVIIRPSDKALTVAKHATGTKIQGNIIAQSGSASVVIKDGVTAFDLSGNLIFDSSGSGVLISDAACSKIHNNAILTSHKQGIQIRNGMDFSIENNLLASNSAAGISIEGQTPNSDLNDLHDNRFISNAIGVKAIGPVSFQLAKNDFSRQLPVLFDGALNAELPRYLAAVKNLREGAPEPFVTRRTALLDDIANQSVEASNAGFRLSNLAYCDRSGD